MALVACDGSGSSRQDSSAPYTAKPGEVPVVQVAQGSLRGVADAATVRFLGVPFAAAPVGDKRWAAPTDPAHWQGERAADVPGAVCEQPRATLEKGARPTEDCLYLNVTAPNKPATSRRPVIVYIHGGGFIQASGSFLDARRMSELGDVVVVTPNYRLGIFGNLTLPGMPEVNFGLQDQLAALRWVKTNISVFGGDPDNVTLGGESAGGLSTCSHLASPAAKGLFAKAIISSGSCTTSYAAFSIDPRIPVPITTWNDRQAIDQMGLGAAASVGCKVPAEAVSCLRRVPPEKLLPLTAQFSLLSTGTPTVPQHPRSKLRADWAHAVPVLAGNTTDEHLGWIAAAYPKATAQTYTQILQHSFGGKAADIARAYPPAKYSSALAALGRVYTDSNWICPTAEANLSYSKTGPTWTYLFGDPQAPTLDGSVVPRPATPHGSDVTYTFPDPDIPLTDAQRRTGDRFIQAWTTFARTGSPRGDDSQSWPAQPDLAYQFGPKDTLVNLNTDHHCTLW